MNAITVNGPEFGLDRCGTHGSEVCLRELSLEEVEAVSGGLTNRQFANGLMLMGAGVALNGAVSALGAPPIAPGAAVAVVGGLGAAYCGAVISFGIDMGWVDPDEQLGASLYARLQGFALWLEAH